MYLLRRKNQELFFFNLYIYLFTREGSSRGMVSSRRLKTRIIAAAYELRLAAD